MQKIEFRAMGCRMTAMVDSPKTVEQLQDVPHWFEMWEQTLSRFRDDSELNTLNRNSGSSVPVSSTLWQVIQVSLQAACTSQGLVTPTLLPALESAGYDRSFDAMGTGVTTQQQSWTRVGDWRTIECDVSTRAIFLPLGMRLDLGGIAKGWAADQAAQSLGAYAPALINAGGDIVASAPPTHSDGWLIGVADPAEPSRNLEWLSIERGAVATSGRDYRRWQRNGVWFHHIIDPRTGQPAETDVISATVVAPTAIEAEVAAKMVLILGFQAGLAWLEEQPGLAGLLVLENGYVIHSQRLAKYLRSKNVSTD